VNRYVIQMKKVIVVEIVAESEDEALQYCMDKDGFNDSWYYAEPQCEVIFALGLQREEGESK